MTVFSAHSEKFPSPATNLGHALFELSPDLMCLCSFAGVLIQVNPIAEQLLGWKQADIQQQPYLDWIHPQDREATATALEKLKNTTQPISFENRMLTQAGDYRWLEWKAVNCAKYQFDGWYAIARDITANKSTTAAYCSLYENTIKGIFQTTPDGRYLSVNPTLAHIYGYHSPEELISQIHTIDRQLYVDPNRRQAFIQQLETQETIANFESQVYRKDGSIIWISESACTARDSEGNLLYYEGFVEDITHRKQIELAQQAYEQRLQTQQQALMQLAQCQPIYNGELDLAWLVITETAARTLNIERASLWFYQSPDEKLGSRFLNWETADLKLVCVDLYQLSIDQHSSGLELPVSSFPHYFRTLAKGKPIATHNTLDDPLTQEFKECYFNTHQITAMLDIPIRLEVQTVGVLCLEQVGKSRSWSLDDQNFASYLAYMASLAMEACDRVHAVEQAAQTAAELAQSLSLLQATLESTAEGIIATDLDGKILTYNQKLTELWGVSCHTLELSDRKTWWKLIGERIKHPALLLQRIEELYQQPELEAHDILELKDGRIFEYHSLPQRLRTRIVGRVWSYGDITERRKVERLKNEFVSMVSHELRTPLTSIRGSLSLIMGGVIGELPPQVKALVEIAHKNSERLVLLINDILDIEKIESGKMDFHVQPLDLKALIQQALEINRAYGEQFQVNFDLQTTFEDSVKVNVDRDRLIQVMTNLLSNAAKYSPPGETITVQLSQPSETTVQVAVCDRGPGIPVAFRDQIFQRFAQADSSDTRQKGGTGLGLSISKVIIEKLGGTIGFQTQTPGGTTFYFTLPQWQPALSTPIIPHKPTILICEDDRDIANLLALMLQRGGFATAIAHTATAAKAQLYQNPTYAAMTIDLTLPDQNGIALIRELRDHETFRNLPIIVVSADAQQGRNEFSGSGFSVVDWLDKPIDCQRLLTALRQASVDKYNHQPRILHVEDDLDVLQVVATILQNLAEIVPAPNLRTAQQELRNQSFDLVILDIELPDGSGLELLPALQKPDQPPIPVAIFSAQDVTKDTASQVAATLVKSRTSNQELLNTIKLLINQTF